MRVRFSSKSSVCNFCDKSLNHLFKKHILRQKKPDKKKSFLKQKLQTKKTLFCQAFFVRFMCVWYHGLTASKQDLTLLKSKLLTD